MKTWFVVLYFVLPFIESQYYEDSYDDDDDENETEVDRFICVGKEDEWEICKECESTRSEICSLKLSSVCRCRNIIVKGQGGSDCQSIDQEEKWCYVDGKSPCSDKTPKSISFKGLDFLNDENDEHGLYSSFMACKDFSESAFEELLQATGNGEFLEDFELDPEDDLGEEFVGPGFVMEKPENCQAECAARSVCYGWTFDQIDEETGNGTCTLKNSPICCNQSTKKIPKVGAISGFNCRKSQGNATYCWSTHAGCKCNQEPGKGASYEFCAGCQNVTETSSVGAIGVIEQPYLWNRAVFKFIQGKWRPVKQKSNK